jgi:hypothetical protein
MMESEAGEPGRRDHQGAAAFRFPQDANASLEMPLIRAALLLNMEVRPRNCLRLLHRTVLCALNLIMEHEVCFFLNGS